MCICVIVTDINLEKLLAWLAERSLIAPNATELVKALHNHIRSLLASVPQETKPDIAPLLFPHAPALVAAILASDSPATLANATNPASSFIASVCSSTSSSSSTASLSSSVASEAAAHSISYPACLAITAALERHTTVRLRRRARTLLGYPATPLLRSWTAVATAYETKNLFLAEAARALSALALTALPAGQRAVAAARKAAAERDARALTLAAGAARAGRAFDADAAAAGLEAEAVASVAQAAAHEAGKITAKADAAVAAATAALAAANANAKNSAIANSTANAATLAAAASKAADAADDAAAAVAALARAPPSALPAVVEAALARSSGGRTHALLLEVAAQTRTAGVAAAALYYGEWARRCDGAAATAGDCEQKQCVRDCGQDATAEGDCERGAIARLRHVLPALAAVLTQSIGETVTDTAPSANNAKSASAAVTSGREQRQTDGGDCGDIDWGEIGFDVEADSTVAAESDNNNANMKNNTNSAGAGEIDWNFSVIEENDSYSNDSKLADSSSTLVSSSASAENKDKPRRLNLWLAESRHALAADLTELESFYTMRLSEIQSNEKATAAGMALSGVIAAFLPVATINVAALLDECTGANDNATKANGDSSDKTAASPLSWLRSDAAAATAATAPGVILLTDTSRMQSWLSQSVAPPLRALTQGSGPLQQHLLLTVSARARAAAAARLAQAALQGPALAARAAAAAARAAAARAEAAKETAEGEGVRRRAK
mgnify:CR=1 FL=1